MLFARILDIMVQTMLKTFSSVRNEPATSDFFQIWMSNIGPMHNFFSCPIILSSSFLGPYPIRVPVILAHLTANTKCSTVG